MSQSQKDTKSSGRMRVLLAALHPLVFEDSRLQLEHTYCVDSLQEVGDGLLLAVQDRLPDVLVMDLLHVSSLNLVSRIARRHPPCRIVVMTGLRNPAGLDMAFEAGVSGILYRMHAAEEIGRAVSAVLGGQRYVSPALGRLAVKDGARRPDPTADLIRNRRFLVRLVEKGCSVPTIAAALGLSTDVVRRAIGNLRKRVGRRGTGRKSSHPENRTWATGARGLR